MLLQLSGWRWSLSGQWSMICTNRILVAWRMLQTSREWLGNVFSFCSLIFLRFCWDWFIFSGDIPVPEYGIKLAYAFGSQFLWVTINWIRVSAMSPLRVADSGIAALDGGWCLSCRGYLAILRDSLDCHNSGVL
jgi:hypothetical protein